MRSAALNVSADDTLHIMWPSSTCHPPALVLISGTVPHNCAVTLRQLPVVEPNMQSSYTVEKSQTLCMRKILRAQKPVCPMSCYIALMLWVGLHACISELHKFGPCIYT